jgi:hypothetical protein
MKHGVHDFRDIPLLFVEGEVDMGAPKKTRAELLDKIIQFIWDYQDKHNGETPSQVLIERHAGIHTNGGSYYMAMLVDEGRLNKISSRPFRVTITEHPANKKAIDRFKRFRERMERADEAERQRIREEQEHNAVAEQRQSDRDAVFASADDTMVVEDRPAPAPERPAIPLENRGEHQTIAPLVAKAARYVDTNDQHRVALRELKTEMGRLIKLADERDLVFELVGRGYTVSKTR